MNFSPSATRYSSHFLESSPHPTIVIVALGLYYAPLAASITVLINCLLLASVAASCFAIVITLEKTHCIWTMMHETPCNLTRAKEGPGLFDEVYHDFTVCLVPLRH
jgi:hypothetical protein